MLRFLVSRPLLVGLLSVVALSPSWAGDVTRMPSGPATPLQPTLITVRVPPGAELWFDDHKQTQIGPTRQFITPPLKVGPRFSYHLPVRWEGGEWSDRLFFEAGEQKTIQVPASTPHP